MTVGENIKRIRKEKKLTQKRLGELCGINEVQIRRYELGGKNANPKLSTIRKIAEALDVTLSELIEDWSLFSKEEIANDWNNPNTLVSDDEKTLIQDYHKLNDNGQSEARKRINELTQIPKYQKKDE